MSIGVGVTVYLHFSIFVCNVCLFLYVWAQFEVRLCGCCASNGFGEGSLWVCDPARACLCVSVYVRRCVYVHVFVCTCESVLGFV